MQKERIITPGQNFPVDERNAVERRLHRLHHLIAIARVAARRVGFFAPFAAARVPQRAALQARFRSRTSSLFLQELTLPCESTVRWPLPLFTPDIIMRL